jgi:vitamin B12 transporter
MHRKSLRTVLSFFLVLASVPLRAETVTAPYSGEEAKPQALEPIVITATRLETPERELASSVTVISRKEIEASQKSNVYDVLRGNPALDVVQAGGPGNTVTLFMRGANSGHTLVLVDGVEAGDPSSTDRSYNLANLGVDNVERIEVIRGPQSTLYGSDAMGGVINVITRKGAGRPQVSLLGEGGTYRTARTEAGLRGGTERVNYALEASRLYTGSFSAQNEKLGATERDGYGKTAYSARVGVTPTANTGVDVVSRYAAGRSRIDASGDDPNYVVDNRQVFARAQGRLGLGDGLFEQKAGASLTVHDRDFDNPVDAAHPTSSSRDSYDSRVARLDWQGDLRLHRSNTLTLGAETERDSAEIDNVSNSSFGPFASHFDQKVARTNGYYVQDQVKFGDAFFATLGARTDDHDRFGSAGTYRATAAYWFHPSATKLKATYGTGFKAPSLFQLYSSFGDPDLDPEESVGWDAGFEQLFSGGKASFGATYFRNDFERLIDFDSVANSYKNVDEATTHGVEYVASWRPVKGLALRANHTVTDTEDKSTGLELLRRAKSKSGASAGWDYGRGDVHLGAVYVGERDDLDFGTFPSTRVTLPSYTVVDLGGSFDVLPHLKLFARLENALDKEYEEVLGFGTPRRGFYAGVRASF